MTDAPAWEDRYHPRKIMHPGNAPKGWDDEFRFAPYLRADTAIATDAPELVALREALADVMDGNNWKLGRKFCGNSGNFSLQTQRAALAAFDAMMERKTK